MTVVKDQVVHCLFQTVRVLADNIGQRESYILKHQASVAKVARVIAQLMGLDRDMIDGIRIGATLQDFGMMRIPSEILNKPGKLTPQEYEIVQQHPVHGFNVLKPIDFPWPVGRMILQHHERLDGSGYPGGLAGDDILIEARVIAVADSMVSMTSDRPYRKAMPVMDALEELSKQRGTKYDEKCVDACVELYTNQPHRLDPEHYRSGGA
jgi:HD-GYP domain-containing protein (c-di-GMP phosphodiesterase class II)